MTTYSGLPLGAKLVAQPGRALHTRPAPESPPWFCKACRKDDQGRGPHLKGSRCLDRSRCACLRCAKRERTALMERHLLIKPGTRGRETLLADDLRTILTWEKQREHRRVVRMAKADLPPGPCHCYRTLPGGSGHCTIGGPGYGVAQSRRVRTRIYRSRACAQFVYRKAKAARQLLDTGEPPLSARAAALPSYDDPRVPAWRRGH